MLITKTSMMSGKTRTQDLPVTEAQLQAWHAGDLIQHAMPNLTEDQREFLMTGITAEEWDEMWAEPTEDHNPDLEDEAF